MATIEHLNNYQALLSLSSSPLWTTVLQRLSALGKDTLEQDITLNESPPIKLYVKKFTTINQLGDKYEAHQDMIDVHLCLDGGEVIFTTPTNNLSTILAYNPDTDTTLFRPPTTTQAVSRFIMRPGNLLILLPNDAHLPAQYDDSHPAVLKAIVKIPATLFT